MDRKGLTQGYVAACLEDVFSLACFVDGRRQEGVRNFCNVQCAMWNVAELFDVPDCGV